MKKNILTKTILMILIVATFACGGLRFSQSAPEAANFHPKKIAVFPIEVWNHRDSIDSRKVVEQIVAGSMVEKKWFASVVDTEALNRQISENEELNKMMTEYMSKLRKLTYSDPDLSRKIGEATQADAFLMLYVDEWGYAGQDNNKLAKVGFFMELYDCSTGKLMWKAGHSIQKDYVVIRPELPDVARELARKMIPQMPR
jgi:hypothetical protein